MNHPAFPLRPLFALAFFLSCFCAAEAKRPNILLIFSDDHAKKALSCYGNQDIETPALDRIANEGMRFEHALTPNSFCTPARAAALTGKYSHRNGVTHLNQRFDGSQQTNLCGHIANAGATAVLCARFRWGCAAKLRIFPA